jgi:hypothetical protein
MVWALGAIVRVGQSKQHRLGTEHLVTMRIRYQYTHVHFDENAILILYKSHHIALACSGWLLETSRQHISTTWAVRCRCDRPETPVSWVWLSRSDDDE